MGKVLTHYLWRTRRPFKILGHSRIQTTLDLYTDEDLDEMRMAQANAIRQADGLRFSADEGGRQGADLRVGILLRPLAPCAKAAGITLCFDQPV
jgi:hypothetical protein